MEKQQFDQQSQLPQQPIYDQQQPPQYQQQQQFQQQPQYQSQQAPPPQYSQQQPQYNQQQQQQHYNHQQQPQYHQQQQQQQPQYQQQQQQPHYQQQGPPPPQPHYQQQHPQYGQQPQQQQPYRQQPVTQQPGPIGAGGWKNHLCGCFNNFQIAITTFLLPFVTFGTTAELVGEGNCILCAAAFFVPGFNCYEWLKIRGKIREMKGIPGSTGTDCAVIFFLPYCALVQEAQEVDPLSVPSALSMSRA